MSCMYCGCSRDDIEIAVELGHVDGDPICCEQ